MSPPVALTIAGSDSGGGAGVQADLKTFAALGVHGTSAVTAVTAQNTRGVSDFVELPVEIIRAQIRDVVADLEPVAAKTGMLASPAIIEAVASAVEEHGISRLVIDPVMVAKGGARLLQEEAVEALRTRLVPLGAVITPNLPEAEALLDRGIGNLADRRRAAVELLALGPRAVVLKAGHAGGDPVDVFFDGHELVELPGRRVDTPNTHGSGCVFSAAITAGLASGLPLLPAVRRAKAFIQGAIEHSLAVGHGHGPVDPMWEVSRPTR